MATSRLACTLLTGVLVFAGRSSAGQPAAQAALLEECARVRTALAARTTVSPQQFTSYPEATATVAELEANLENLYVAAFGVGALAPPADGKAPRRASDGVSREDLAPIVEDIDRTLVWIAERRRIIGRNNSAGPSAPVWESVRLRAGERFWREERARVIDATKIR